MSRVGKLSRVSKWIVLSFLFLVPSIISAQACSNTVYGHWTCVQQTNGANNGGDVVMTFGGAVGAGSLLIVEAQSCLGSVGGCDLNVATPVVSDTVNGSWGTCGVFFQDVGFPPSVQVSICAFCGSAAGTPTVTHFFSPNTGNRNSHVAFVQEWTSSDGNCNSGAGGGIDATGHNASASQASPFSVTSSASNNPNELAISIMAFMTNAATTVNSPFTMIDSNATFGDWTAAAPAPTATTYTSTYQNGTTIKFVAVIATFRISASAGLTSAPSRSKIIDYKEKTFKIPWNRSRKFEELERI